MSQDYHVILEYDKDNRREYFRNKALGLNSDEDTVKTPEDFFEVSCKEQLNPLKKNVVQNIYLHNIKPEDMDAIREKMNRNPEFFTQAISIPRGRNISSNTIVITVNDEDVKYWVNNGGLEELQKILKSSGNYDNEAIDNLGGVIKNRLTSKGESSELFKASKDSAIDTWLSYLEKINDAETMELLKLYARIFQNTDEGFFGHILSIKNVAMIRAVDSQASFVLPETTWHKLNRYVIPGAKKYIVLTPNDQNKKGFGKTLRDIIDKYCVGYKGCAYSELPIQMQIEVDIQCNKIGISSYRPVVEFDVSQTKVIPGKEDLFTQQAGLSNNLTGELNTKAKETLCDINSENMPEDEIMRNRTQKAADFMVDFCKNNNIQVQVNPNDNASTKLINCLYYYYLSRAEKDANLDKDTNKDYFAKNATHFTLIFTKLAWERLGTFSHPVTYTKKEGAEFLNMVNTVLRNLEPAIALNESIDGGINKNALINAFKKYCSENNITIV
jgi:hypothetical protein